MILADSLAIGYPEKRLVSNLSFTIEDGEIGVVVGQSGCGKTTLLNTLMGVTVALEGTIIIDRITVAHSTLSEIWKRTAFVPQDLNFPVETVKEMVHLSLNFRHNAKQLRSKHLENDILRTFESLGLEQQIYEKTLDLLSGGERQRVLLAIAKLLNKKVLFVDEPTSALDPSSIEKVLLLFRQLSAEGVTIIATSHNPLLIKAADQIINLDPI